MTKITPFWQKVRELAAMRGNIPEERREMSGVRDAVRLDVRDDAASSSDLLRDRSQQRDSDER